MQKPFVFVGKPAQRKKKKRSPKRGPEEENVKKPQVLCAKSKFGEF